MNAIEIKAKTEMLRVAKTYELIAESFSRTRKSPWISVLSEAGDMTGKNILDVGCGNGRHLIQVAKKASIAIGIDVSRKLVKIANKWIKKLNLTNKTMVVVGDALNMPFRDSAFDIALCIATIHHIPTKTLRAKAIGEMTRVIKGKGSILISAWHRWQRRLIPSILKSALMRITGMVFEFGDTYIPWRSGRTKYMRFYHLFTPKEMEELLKIHELEVRALKIMEIGRRKWKNVVALAIKR